MPVNAPPHYRVRTVHRPAERLGSQFDSVYDSRIVEAGFFETAEYYRMEKERYRRSLQLFCQLNVPAPASILEIGGRGQMAVLCKELFGDHCTVADISQEFSSPLQKAGIELVTDLLPCFRRN
jgi:hypothetical protein